jgi:hypothetical protein
MPKRLACPPLHVKLQRKFFFAILCTFTLQNTGRQAR